LEQAAAKGGDGVICDFCSAPDPPHRILCRSFTAARAILPKVRFESVSDWWACDTCHALVVAEDRGGLLERGVRAACERDPYLAAHRVAFGEYLGRIYVQFWESRILEGRKDATT
jgi:hypothetical protein